MSTARPCYQTEPAATHEALPAKWGLVNFWMTDRKQAFKNINARAETIQTAHIFSHSD